MDIEKDILTMNEINVIGESLFHSPTDGSYTVKIKDSVCRFDLVGEKPNGLYLFRLSKKVLIEENKERV